MQLFPGISCLKRLRVKSLPVLSFQDVVSHSKKLTKKNKEQLSDMMMLNKQRGGLKALSKEKREKLEAYQHLFYLLQVSNFLHCSVSFCHRSLYASAQSLLVRCSCHTSSKVGKDI